MTPQEQCTPRNEGRMMDFMDQVIRSSSLKSLNFGGPSPLPMRCEKWIPYTTSFDGSSAKSVPTPVRVDADSILVEYDEPRATSRLGR